MGLRRRSPKGDRPPCTCDCSCCRPRVQASRFAGEVCAWAKAPVGVGGGRRFAGAPPPLPVVRTLLLRQGRPLGPALRGRRRVNCLRTGLLGGDLTRSGAPPFLRPPGPSGGLVSARGGRGCWLSASHPARIPRPPSGLAPGCLAGRHRGRVGTAGPAGARCFLGGKGALFPRALGRGRAHRCRLPVEPSGLGRTDGAAMVT